MRPKTWFFDKINKIDKPLRLTKIKRGNSFFDLILKNFGHNQFTVLWQLILKMMLINPMCPAQDNEGSGNHVT